MLNNIEDKEEGNNLLAPMSIKKFFDQMDDETLQVLVYNNKLIDLCNALTIELHSSKSAVENEC
jgi:hypothetical protein|tara:strand:+ start:433 stop:624 length:192 start_codon:yes stop_codon:yes gene_type:complete